MEGGVTEGRIAVVSIVDQVYESLRERIVRGELPSDGRLRQEALAADLGVSRTPLREALRRLASEGLIELEPNRGARVITPTNADLLAAYEARLVLEPAAASLAAQRADPAAIEAMRSAIASHRRARSPGALFEANRAFHLALVATTGNEHLERFAELLWATRIGALIYARQDETPEQVRRDADEHEQIADAIAARDATAAEAITRSHIAGALEAFAARG